MGWRSVQEARGADIAATDDLDREFHHNSLSTFTYNWHVNKDRRWIKNGPVA